MMTVIVENFDFPAESEGKLQMELNRWVLRWNRTVVDKHRCKYPGRSGEYNRNIVTKYKVDSRLAHSQWETSLQSNAISHWLFVNLESALKYIQGIYNPIN